MDSRIIGKCWYCGHGLGEADYAREADCLGCRKPTRACRNCCMYSPGQANDCAEPMAEHILDKIRANFCEHFDPSDSPRSGPAKTAPDALIMAAEDLFKL